METISGAWAFIIEASAGLGLVLILRWFWWRINAWSEIAAMVAPLLIFAYVRSVADVQFPESLYYIVSSTTLIWLAATFLTKPTDEEVLKNFYRRVHPGGAGWIRIASLVPDVRGDSGYRWLMLDWLAGVVLVYSMLFGIGKLILGDTGMGIVYFAVGLLSAGVIYRDVSRRGFANISKY